MSKIPACTAKLDRWRFAVLESPQKWQGRPPSIPGFQIVKDSFVRQQTKVGTYGRVRSMENPKTGTKLFIQYGKKHGWLKPMLVTAVANAHTGIVKDLLAISTAFGHIKTRMVEIAFDCSAESGIDRKFVLEHGLFGKSRPNHDPRFPHQLRYGTRHSAKLVRCYFKKETGTFRVEIELHSTWPGLPENGRTLHTLPLRPKDFRFVDLVWETLDFYIRHKFPSGTLGIDAPRYGLHGCLSSLTAAGVNNPHLFLQPSQKDRLIRNAFAEWQRSIRPGGKQ